MRSPRPPGASATPRSNQAELDPGPDGFPIQCYKRNLRTFANLRRVARSGQRVVVLFGAGHVPILWACVTASRE